MFSSQLTHSLPLLSDAPTVNGKLKYYQSALELIFQCHTMLKIMSDRTQAVDGILRTPPKPLKAKLTSPGDSCAEEVVDSDQVRCCKKKAASGQMSNQGSLPNNGRSDVTGETVYMEEDLAEQKEEYKMIKLLEQRFQFILLKLTHLYTSGLKANQTKKE